MYQRCSTRRQFNEVENALSRLQKLNVIDPKPIFERRHTDSTTGIDRSRMILAREPVILRSHAAGKQARHEPELLADALVAQSTMPTEAHAPSE